MYSIICIIPIICTISLSATMFSFNRFYFVQFYLVARNSRGNPIKSPKSCIWKRARSISRLLCIVQYVYDCLLYSCEIVVSRSTVARWASRMAHAPLSASWFPRPTFRPDDADWHHIYTVMSLSRARTANGGRLFPSSCSYKVKSLRNAATSPSLQIWRQSSDKTRDSLHTYKDQSYPQLNQFFILLYIFSGDSRKVNYISVNFNAMFIETCCTTRLRASHALSAKTLSV